MALITGLLLVALAIPRPAGAITKESLNRALVTTVKLGVLNAQSKVIGSCSGTVVNATGYVLTNWHCVGRTNDDPEDQSEQNRRPGEMFHPQGLVIIAPTRDARTEPVPTYRGQVAAGTPELDVAVVKIVGMIDQQEKLPASLSLAAMALGDSDKADLGDPVHVLGYPDIGGALINLSSGIISGFDDRNQDGQLDSIKTTAEMAPGVSGGLAMNDLGEQLGIPTWGRTEGAAKIDRMMMVNIAKTYIDQALTGQGAPVTSPQAQPPSGKGVVLRGKIIDADTKRPISNAAYGALNAGVTAAQWERSGFSADLVAAEGIADQNGAFQTAPPLEVGKTYTALAAFRGYQPRVFENGLKLAADAPAVIDLDPIALKKN